LLQKDPFARLFQRNAETPEKRVTASTGDFGPKSNKTTTCKGMHHGDKGETDRRNKRGTSPMDRKKKGQKTRSHVQSPRFRF